jgi:hypothetical protein
MPEQNTPSRLARLLLRIALLAVLTGATACGLEPDPGREPGPSDLDSLEFTPAATFEVSSQGIDPETFDGEAGDVVLLENVGDEPVRVRGDDLDTGTMEPGETVTVVLSASEDDLVWTVLDTDHEAVVSVRPTD